MSECLGGHLMASQGQPTTEEKSRKFMMSAAIPRVL